MKIGKQRGQTSIFVVLLFNVLFVFFAMVVNIGLIVHDKINLQNSVDLAAIYGAQKQAEALNAIAHLNYQIRQSWKLLAWRTRALGDMGRGTHPTYTAFKSGADTSGLWEQAKSGVGGSASHPKSVVLCFNHDAWLGTDSNGQNVCRDGFGINIPQLQIPKLSGFPWDRQLVSAIKSIKANFTQQCRGVGVKSFYAGATWVASYKEDVRNRMDAIFKLSNFLQQDLDITSSSIGEGAQKTLRANLTTENLDSLELVDTFNSVQTKDGAPEAFRWFNKTRLYPQLYYVDLNSACVGSIKNLWGSDGNIQKPTGMNNVAIPEYYLGILTEGEEADPLSEKALGQATIGIEKSPWVMMYYGVKAESRPRKPFFPFGSPIKLVARAFAKPFGGRIGPWLHNTWSRDSVKWPSSAGSSSGALIDSNLAVGGEGFDGFDLIPNFSLFPGDKHGLVNGLALKSAGAYLREKVRPSKLKIDAYTSFPEALGKTVLAYEQSPSPQLAGLQSLEVAAVSPNVFDLSYYSIQPNFSKTYIPKLKTSLGDIADQLHDIGFVLGEGDFFSVRQQIDRVIGSPMQTGFKVFNWEHLLNSWVANDTMDFSFPETNFAQCHKQIPEDGPGTEGDCVAGGRAGYSVKIVSKEYLESELPLGNQENVYDKIVNPPPSDF